MNRIKERDQLIKEWMEIAAKDIKKSLEYELEVEVKTRKNDLVTNMDRKTEKYFVTNIKKHFPEDKIVSEEGFGDHFNDIVKKEDTIWYLDPIDGTSNFVLQKERFGIMIAVYEKNIGQQAYIYDVMEGELYWTIKDQGVYRNDKRLEPMQNLSLADGLFASNSMFVSDRQVELNTDITKSAMGVRTIGSAAMEVAELVKGNTVAYLSYGLKAWDIAAGYMMIKESGGQVARLDGSAINFFEPEPTIMGTTASVKEIQELL